MEKKMRPSSLLLPLLAIIAAHQVQAQGLSHLLAGRQQAPQQVREATWTPTQLGAALQNASVAPAHAPATPPPLSPHLERLNGLVASGASQLAAGNLTQVGAAAARNVLEVLSNVGKALHQQMQQPIGGLQQQQPANSQLANASLPAASSPSAAATSNLGQRNEQGELLRQEIMKRAGQLQQVVASSLEMMKSNSDLIVRRLLEQLGQRLEQAKQKADRVMLADPAAGGEVAIRALMTINQGLNNVSNIVSNIVARLEAAQAAGNSINTSGNNLQQRAAAAPAGGMPLASNPPAAAPGPALLLDPARLRASLDQLKQQFTAAVQAAQQQRQASHRLT